MEIYIVRHGQSEANLSKTVQGTMDSPLTELGRKQARQLRDILPSDLDHVYLSSLSRAYETGEIATEFSNNGLNFSVHDELQEICFGDLQGMPYNNTGYDNTIIKRHVRFEQDILQGNHQAETIEAFFNRTHGIFDEILTDMKENEWSRVAVFTHGGVLRSILQYQLELTEDRFENCEIAYLKYDNNQDHWHLDRKRKHIIFE